MQLLKTKSFSRWARKEGLRDRALFEAAEEMRHGLVDADLGSGLMKQRLARAGGGKSGGYRVLVATDMRLRCVFLYGYAKSERDDLDEGSVERGLALGQLMEVDSGESKTA